MFLIEAFIAHEHGGLIIIRYRFGCSTIIPGPRGEEGISVRIQQRGYPWSTREPVEGPWTASSPRLALY